MYCIVSGVDEALKRGQPLAHVNSSPLTRSIPMIGGNSVWSLMKLLAEQTFLRSVQSISFQTKSSSGLMMILYLFRSLDHRWLVRKGVTRFTKTVYFLIYQGKLALKSAQNECTFRKHTMFKNLVLFIWETIDWL